MLTFVGSVVRDHFCGNIRETSLAEAHQQVAQILQTKSSTLEMRLLGVPTLRSLCVSLLVDFRDCLGDLGDTPLDLVHPVLLQCNAEQLASIEDGSRDGGRDLHEALQLHWQRNFINDFGWHNSELVSTSTSPGTKLASRKWRQLYERAEEAHRQKAAGLGERLRAMTQAERKSRQTRHVEVIAPTRAFAKHKASRQAGSTKSPKQIIPARQRVLSKLGLTHNKSLKHLVRIRPAKAVQPQAIRHAHNIRQAPGQHLQPAPRASATAERPANNDQSKDTVSPQRGLSVQQSKLQHDPVRGQAQRDRGATAAEDMQQSVAQPGLVEADIDWLPSATSSQTFADHHALQPVAEQPWTVQYLEEGMQHDHRGRLASKSALECIVEADKSPCNNDTFAWMEDDIPW